ncbi:hypothetical protein RRV45_12070 [Bacillus sp. DTU_2020_1000418_1_SI_GHA_SEK_038]|uniref:hypothetical protein n=1 Tax=Bacillus sp. DTU_2020_1000418_1_SI_GHA_SEK_038 TaxID=3077585 RepID=UPI0028EE5375|nr:hypothetical protein [Bacillus sp. DTU_2020_1000418_1_SI_GHA_SEK_038]WNS73656.1 hypothetical protein RRV45_12070 [Bacillus sp. DTU_2020_1000418_1_SI_GHA_SEK_038]
MNKNLLNLYSRHWSDMVSSLEGNQLSNPLLLYINDEDKYKYADIKIMFFGQETNTWEGELGNKSIDELLVTYSNFFGNGKCFKYGGPFWNTVKDYVNTIKQLNPDKSVECVWNNIIKIGKEKTKGAPDKSLVNIQKEKFPVIKEEIEILKPDLIIFFTGPNYDQYIKTEWRDLKINSVNSWETRKIALLKHELLPNNTIRTYHPNFMYMKGKQFYSNIKDSITTNILS